MIDWTILIQECAPQVSSSLIHAVIRAESGFNPLAININGNVKLARTPSTKDEAIKWAKWLASQGYSIDLGLMQINLGNLRRLGLDLSTVFDPCKNLSAGANVLAENYSRALQQSPNSQVAVLKAISAYNSGNFRSGFNNGYVQKVAQQPAKIYLQTDPIVPPLRKLNDQQLAVIKRNAGPTQENNNLNEELVNKSLYSAETAITGFGNATNWSVTEDVKQ